VPEEMTTRALGEVAMQGRQRIAWLPCGNGDPLGANALFDMASASGATKLSRAGVEIGDSGLSAWDPEE